MATRPRAHVAFAVDDLAQAREFYLVALGCAEGRSTGTWVDFDLFGHQFVAHLAPDDCNPPTSNDVDGRQVPASHFGLILSIPDWDALVGRLAEHNVTWLIEPTVRFEGEIGEQRTCFVLDPAGNALEFKAFADDDQIFAR
jgi:extradiol dioxygenase family protein